MLFEYEYSVPFLSPTFSAYLATGAELIFPLFILIGCATKFSAVSLFILNYVALIAYTDISPVGEIQHILWGTLLTYLFIYLFIYGAKSYSADKFLSLK